MNKIVILGNSGFIGRNVFAYLHEFYKDEVIGFSSNTCDLLNFLETSEILSKYMHNVSFIFISGITRLQDNSSLSFYKNINMVNNFIDAVKDHASVQHIIFISTIDVYGSANNSNIISEKTSINPADYYSLSKYVCEFFLNDFCQKSNIPLTILRLTGVFGPYDEGKSTINNLVKSALSLKEITLYDLGNDTRDFLYVKDLSRIIAKCLELKPKKILNIASGQSLSISTYAQKIITAINDPLITIKYAESEVYNRRKHIKFDISLFKHEFSDFSFLTFSESIIDYLKEYKNE